MKKVLILGATGNIAGIAAKLLSENTEISLRLASSRAEGLAKLKEQYPQCEVVQADWHDVDSLKAAFQGVHRVMVNVPDFLTDETIVTPTIVAAARSTPSLEQLVRLIALDPDFCVSKMTKEWLATRGGSALSYVAKPILDASGLPVTYVNVVSWIGFNLIGMAAEDVKLHRRMPFYADAPRSWLAEQDIAEIFAKILAEGPTRHLGQHYVITGPHKYWFNDVARMLSDEVGAEVKWIDTPDKLHELMGPLGDTAITYFQHEQKGWDKLPITNTAKELLGREPMSLREYIHLNREFF
ncbi:NmrA family NAD(P)-binding protein [Paraburkholderia sp. Se-20369]|nr:NmrA family NAD(P)-binding protein [Paraburkholderia sp. Se-20369]